MTYDKFKALHEAICAKNHEDSKAIMETLFEDKDKSPIDNYKGITEAMAQTEQTEKRPCGKEDPIKVSRMECLRPDWVRVVNAARRTWGKAPIAHEPSDFFKKKILLAEHSPIRLLEYDFTWEDIRQWVTVHLVRHHEGCEKFVHSQRQDLRNLSSDYGVKSRDELPQGALNDMDMTCNAQAFINISRKRLCRCASPETRRAWETVMEYLKQVDPMLESVCVPECIYRGFCPEHDRCCGYVHTESYKKRLEQYRSLPEKNFKNTDRLKDKTES